MRNPTSDQLADLWFTHDVVLHSQVKRTARGVERGPDTPLKASINMESRTIPSGLPGGEETVINGTVNWEVDGPLPEPGATLTLPSWVGSKTTREVVSAKRAYSGTGLTPDHVEVMIR